jgi:hypothetical protein
MVACFIHHSRTDIPDNLLHKNVHTEEKVINRHLILLTTFSFMILNNSFAEKKPETSIKSSGNIIVKQEIGKQSASGEKIIPALGENITQNIIPIKNTASHQDIKLDVISPDELLGLTPEEAYQKMGVPIEIFPMRGENEWQDDVVFYHDNHVYLFWFKNRVWQFRADKRFEGTILGLKIGLNRKAVNKMFGKPFKKNDFSEIYLNPKGITRYETGFPVRLKIFYDENNMTSDIYIYRGDF